MPAIYDFATWKPVLRLVYARNTATLAAAGGHVAGRIGRGWWTLPSQIRQPSEDMRRELDAVGRVQDALADAGLDGISFVLETPSPGRIVLYLLTFGPAVEPDIGVYPGALILVEGSLPEPWRRLPDRAPDAVPAASKDLALLERTLRERIPDGTGATETEIAATEARIGVALPDELKVLYRVTSGRWQDWDDDEAAQRLFDAVGCELFTLDKVYVADPPSRPCPWQFAATEAVVTPPDAAVQGVVGSPGWIAFADSGGGDRIAVDLTPGPRGHLGQIILLDHEQNIGATLLADSLTDMVVSLPDEYAIDPGDDKAPAVAHVNNGRLTSIQAAADPGLEVLSIGVWDGEPFSLAPVIGLPRLRTLIASPGTLANPLDIAKLTTLEYLELGPEQWRVLLDAGATPRSLSAAAIQSMDNPHPLQILSLANEILALWDRPPITQTILEGRLGPGA